MGWPRHLTASGWKHFYAPSPTKSAKLRSGLARHLGQGIFAIVQILLISHKPGLRRAARPSAQLL